MIEKNTAIVLLGLGLLVDLFNVYLTVSGFRRGWGPSGLPFYPWVAYVGASLLWWPNIPAKVLSGLILTAFHYFCLAGLGDVLWWFRSRRLNPRWKKRQTRR